MTTRHLRLVEDQDHRLLVYGGHRLDGSLQEFHRAVDLLEAETVPRLYYEKVLASRARRESEARRRGRR